MDFNRSLFIESQIPQYIRDTYPLFVSFIKQYYSYLDRSIGQLIAVKVTNSGKNYSAAPTVQLQILDNVVSSVTYGQYISDTKGAVVTAVIKQGQLTKIVVSAYGSGYTDADAVRVVITDTTGSGAVAAPVVVNNLGNINQATKASVSVRDIDNEYDLLTTYLTNEYIPNFPVNLYSNDVTVEVNKFVKFIKQFYGSKGTEDSLRFLYRILFNTDLNFYYPSTDMLRVSDGKWTQNNYLSLTGAPGIDPNGYVGHRVIGNTSNAVALVDSVGATGAVYLYDLSGINGAFSTTPEDLYNYPITGKAEKIGTTYNTGATSIFYVANGSYLGTDGQPSSNKKIQDSRYYQQFSYELRADQSITQFKNLIEELIHPAGLKYFIFLTLNEQIAYHIYTRATATALVGATGGVLSYSITNPGYNYSSVPTVTVTGAPNTAVAFATIYAGSVTAITFTSGNTGYTVVPTITFDDPLTTGITDSETNVNPRPDISIVSSSSPACAALGPTYQNIDFFKSYTEPIFFEDFSGTTTTQGSTGATGVLNIGASGHFTNDSDLVGFTAIIGATGATGVLTRTVTRYNSANQSITFDTPIQFGYPGSVCSYRLLENPRFTFVNNTNGTMKGATAFGNLLNYGFTNYVVSTLSAAVDASTGVIPVVTQNDDYYNTNDVILVDSEKMLINGATGSLAGATSFLNVTRAYYGTGATTHTIGATAFSTSRHAFRDYKLYVTSGTGSGQSSTIVGFDGASGIITYSPVFSTAPNTNSTYYISKDLYNNSGYFTTYVDSITLLSGGSGYSSGATGPLVTIDAPLVGTQATAYATVVGGVITALTLGATGSGYITTPKVTITNPTAITVPAFAYVDLKSNTSAPAADYLNYSSVGGVILSVPGATGVFKTAQAKATIANGSITGITVIAGASGAGYVETPRVTLNGGGATITYSGTTVTDSGGQAYAEVSGGSVVSIVLTTNGLDYTSPPSVVIDAPGIRKGCRVIQPSTGAQGSVDEWDQDNNLLYIFKDPVSPDFTASTLSCNGLNIPVASVSGNYSTRGKRIKSIQESEINIIKV